MSETVQGLLIGGIVTVIGGFLINFPSWLKARAEARAVAQSVIDKSNADTFARITDTQSRTDARTVRLEVQVDTLRAELLEARGEINILTKQLAEEKEARNPLNLEISALKEKVLGLEKQVVELLDHIRDLTAKIKGQGEK